MLDKDGSDLNNCFFQQLKQMRDKLKQYKNRIEIKLNNEREIAKELVKNGKIE